MNALLSKELYQQYQTFAMVFSEQQLERFSKPPFKYERQQIVDTHQEIRKAIISFYDFHSIREKYDLSEIPDIIPFLQGSYCNDTNVTKSSDVDIVIKLKNVWRADTSLLSSDELAKYRDSRKDCGYYFHLFNQDIINCLQRHFGSQNIFNDNKCIRLKGHGKFCDADIIPAFLYRSYGTFSRIEQQTFDEGICFDTNDGKQIINFPKQHEEALSSKSKQTNGNFKETVRMFKNIRDELMDHRIVNAGIAKSYFVENLLFNVKDSAFTGSYTDRFRNILNILIHDYNSGSVSNYKCANGIHKLHSEHTWNIESLRQLLTGLIFVRDKNTF